ncbi:MAG TPA: hypothetical protein PK264_24405, partial [Hyphomicrobiaceae bacterium]|nr:hypothetical protein [Hyphomicrobiaceae bacterium]
MAADAAVTMLEKAPKAGQPSAAVAAPGADTMMGMELAAPVKEARKGPAPVDSRSVYERRRTAG